MTDLPETIFSRLENECKCPVAVIDYPTEKYDCICVEDSKIFENLVDHVIDIHHCSKIMFVSGSYDVTSTKCRFGGYKKSLEKHNIPVDEDFVCFDAKFTKEGASEIAGDIVSGKRLMPDAIICCGDQMAVGIMTVFQESGIKIPDDVIVIGFDATDEGAIFSPSLTTCEPAVFEAGENAVLDIDARIKGLEPDNFIHGGGKIVLGGSCGCGAHYNGTIRNQFFSKANLECLEFLNSNMIEDLAETENFRMLLYKIEYYLYLIKGWNNFYLCLCDYWLNNDIYRGDSGYFTTDYSDVMTTFINSENKYCRTVRDSFHKEEMLPEIFDNERDEPTVFYFTPVHLNKKCFGYSVISFDDYRKVIDITYMNWCRHISNALEFVRVQTEISGVAMRDVLTGVYSRYGMEKLIRSKYKNNYDDGCNMIVMLADVDRLKMINDEYGHSYGDLAIISVAKSLTLPLTPKEICARIGGDEFLIIGFGKYDESFIEEYNQKFEKNLSLINDSKEYPFEISASIGGVISKIDNINDLNELYKLADKEMYRIKKAKHVERH